MNDNEEYTETSAADMAAEIAGSLFESAPETAVDESTKVQPVAGETPDPVVPEGDKPVVQASETNPAVIPGQNSVAKALPKSWKRDMAPHWEKLPPEVHDYVYAREADVMRGIQSYQQGAQAWNSLIQPFAPIFQQHPDVNPGELMQGLMQTHLRLLDPAMPSANKAALARQIMSDYGIDLAAEGLPAPDAAMQEINSLRAELAAVQNRFKQQDLQTKEAGVQSQLNAIKAFAADPANKYFDEVGNDILELVQSGVAADIATAYQKACWLNPTVRAKLIAEQQSPKLPVVDKQRDSKGKFVNLESTEVPATRTRKSGSIDQTIDSVINNAYSSKH